MRKRITMVILLLALCSDLGTAWAGGTTGADGKPSTMLDALRLPYSQQIHTFWRTLARCVEEDPDFQISARVREYGSPGTKSYLCTYDYTVKLPAFMSAGLPAMRRSDEQPLLDMLLAQALQKKEDSYYAALLAIQAGYGHVAGHSPTPPLVDKDKTKWEEGHALFAGLWLSECDYRQNAQERYLRWLFLRLLSKEHQHELGVGRGVLVGANYSMLEHRKLRADIEQGVEVVGGDESLAVGDVIVGYSTKADTGIVAKLPVDRQTLLIWSAFLVNTDEKDIPSVINAFLAYAQAHQKVALGTDMALALLVVRGYEYDAEKGRYKLTATGQRLLEHAIEHPIPELLRLAEVLKDRWDEGALMELIHRHHADVKTWEEFCRKVAGAR